MALENKRNASVRERDRDEDSKIGLVFPLTRGKDGYFKSSSTLLEQTKSNMKNLLLTVKGERPFQPDLGCDIFNILFEPATEDLSSDIDGSIREAVGKWLPHVSLKGVIVDIDNNTVNITVTFSIVTDPNATESISLALNRVGV
jgi:phage baseplate assembly protein W